MTAALQQGVAGFLARYEALRDRLPGDPRPRAEAADAFRRAGLPGHRITGRGGGVEYTSLRPVADATFQQPVAHLAGDSRLLACLPPLAAPRIVFVDGEFRPELSALPASVDFARFADRAESAASRTLTASRWSR
jgi:Fe-S cluster assembly protein SufD